MKNVYIEARPKDRKHRDLIEDYIVEDHADQELACFNTQAEAVEWARQQGHRPLVARVWLLTNKKVPEHWRAA